MPYKTYEEHVKAMKSIVPGVFNNSSTLSKIAERREFVQHLKILSSGFKALTNPSNHWLPALALFHYSTEFEHPDWDSDHALIMTLADLFGEKVKSPYRSEDNGHCMIMTARAYIRGMEKFQPDWSRITLDHYKMILEEYPTWPTIEDPTVDSKGAKVKDENLIEAFAYCFQEPVDKVILRIRSGLWAVVIASATNGRITDEMLDRTTRDLSDQFSLSLVITKRLIYLIIEHLLEYPVEMISAKNLFKNLTSESCQEKQRRVKSIIERATWASFPELKMIVKALERFPDFDWEVVYKKEGASLVKEIEKLKSCEGFLTDCYDPSQYGAFAYVAKDLFIRFNYMKNSDFDDWCTLPICSREVVESIDRYIFRNEKHVLPEAIVEVLNDLRI